MLTCIKCETENGDGSAFCKNCGEKLPLPETPAESLPQNPSVDILAVGNKAEKPPLRIVILFIAVLAFILGSYFFVQANKVNKIDSQLFCSVVYFGLDGYGTAEVLVDTDKFSELLDDFDLTNAAKTEAEQLLSTLKFTIPSNGSLKNNTEYTVSGAYDAPAMKKLKIEITGLEWETRTADLMEPEILDPFEGLQLYVEGFEPYGTYSLDIGGCDEFVQAYIQFEVDGEDGALSNGDVVTIRALYDAQHLIDCGYIVESDEQTYKIKGLWSYPKSLDGFDLSNVNQALKDCLNRNTSMSAFWGGANYWGSSWKKEYELTFRESVFVVSENPAEAELKNRFINFYNLKITNTCVQNTFSGSVGDVVTETIYIALQTDNLTTDGSGWLSLDSETSDTDWSTTDQTFEVFYQEKLAGLDGYQVLRVENPGA